MHFRELELASRHDNHVELKLMIHDDDTTRSQSFLLHTLKLKFPQVTYSQDLSRFPQVTLSRCPDRMNFLYSDGLYSPSL